MEQNKTSDRVNNPVEQLAKKGNKSANSTTWVILISSVVLLLVVLSVLTYIFINREKDLNKKIEDLQSQAQRVNSEQDSPLSSGSANDEYKDWKEYKSSELGISFKHPKEWTVKPISYDGQIQSIEVSSSDVQTQEIEIGGTDVIRGSVVNIYKPESGDINSFSGLQETLRENGTISPKSVTIGEYSGIEYSYAYEGPEQTYIRIGLANSQFLESSFMSEGNESTHPSFTIYKKLLASLLQ
ncbi:MAG: hypothetical protein QG623_215 [Patescibacteria group bacterium]|nr:hypothetical protein [Patescibacteria group bacterium]